MMRNKKVLLRLFLVLLVLIFISMSIHFYLSRAPGTGNSNQYFEVQRGIGSNSVIKELHRLSLIQNPYYFKFFLRITGRSGKIKAGLYELNDGMAGGTIIDILTEGRVQMISMTIPEGWNRTQIADELVRKKIIQNTRDFIKITTDRSILKQFRIRGKSTEGYLFPDTYSFPIGFPAQKLQIIMVENFFRQLNNIGVSDSMNRIELQKKVILASIVEREAVKPAERGVMAQVFLNRLKKEMRLESCATIQFLLKRPRARLYNRDLQIKSPYNTYLHKGLPPGPISNPGLAALKAAFQPKKGDFLYFVLKPDSSHYFSINYQEHLNAKKRFLGR